MKLKKWQFIFLASEAVEGASAASDRQNSPIWVYNRVAKIFAFLLSKWFFITILSLKVRIYVTDGGMTFILSLTLVSTLAIWIENHWKMQDFVHFPLTYAHFFPVSSSLMLIKTTSVPPNIGLRILKTPIRFLYLQK